MNDAKPVTRPDPIPTDDSLFFWEAAARGELMGQQCGNCGTYLHPPRPMCPHCHSLNQRHVPLCGRGSVYSWCLPRHPQVPAFDYPLVTALIDLDEGIRLLSNIVGCDPQQVANGMPVQVCFAPTAGGQAVPQFRPVDRKPIGNP
jgi:uncharacterized OB-fold protein